MIKNEVKKAVIITGSNTGDRLNYLNSARTKIKSVAGKIINSSSIYESEAWGYEDTKNYYNQVIVIETQHSAKDLLNLLLSIERGLHRIRTKNQRYSARTIDLDILFFEDEIINSEDLIVPHPRLHLRKFTLTALAEIMPDYVHPVLNKKISYLLDDCLDEGMVVLV